jgi:hypothetical protein
MKLLIMHFSSSSNYLFLSGLFNNAVSSSDHTALYDRMTLYDNELERK